MENVRIRRFGLWRWELADDFNLEQRPHHHILEPIRRVAERDPEPVIIDTASYPGGHQRHSMLPSAGYRVSRALVDDDLIFLVQIESCHIRNEVLGPHIAEAILL